MLAAEHRMQRCMVKLDAILYLSTFFCLMCKIFVKYTQDTDASFSTQIIQNATLFT